MTWIIRMSTIFVVAMMVANVTLADVSQYNYSVPVFACWKASSSRCRVGFLHQGKFVPVTRVANRLRNLLKGKTHRQKNRITSSFSGKTTLTSTLYSLRKNTSFRSLKRKCRRKGWNLQKTVSCENPSEPIPTPTPTPVTTNPTPNPTQTPTPTPTPTEPPVVTPTPEATPQPSATPAPSPTPVAGTPLPEKALWESQMIEFGTRNCNRLQDSGQSFDVRLNATYYDAEWVFYQIADYTGDSSWLNCAAAARSVYRDQYALANNGNVPGYWNFTHGILNHYLRTGNSTSYNALGLISQNAAFSPDWTPLSSTAHVDLSREVAYTMMGYLNAELAGYPRRARVHEMRDQALGHLDQWFVTNSAPYMRPFMVALTAHALITYDEIIGDSRILPRLEQAMDQVWARTWIPSQGSFMYTDRWHSTGGQEPAPDLNMLIAPVYGWLYAKTGNQRHLDRGDQIFAGGVRQAYLINGKQFNQNYRWSFQYLQWRGGQ